MSPGPRGSGGPLGAEQVRVKLDLDGTVVLYTAQMPHGQGHQTTLAQIAADQMGVTFEQVRVVVGDTNVVPPGFTGGSRSATMAGGAALVASRSLRERVVQLASELMEASPDDIVAADGRIGVAGAPARALTWSDLAQRAESPKPLRSDRLAPGHRVIRRFRRPRACSRVLLASAVSLGPRSSRTLRRTPGRPSPLLVLS